MTKVKTRELGIKSLVSWGGNEVHSPSLAMVQASDGHRQIYWDWLCCKINMFYILLLQFNFYYMKNVMLY